MSTLSDYAPSLLAWLLETSWQVAVLIGLILLVRGLLGNWISPAWRVGLWCLVLIRLLLPVLPGSPFSVFNLWVTEQTLIEALTFQWAPVPVTLSTLPSPQATQEVLIAETNKDSLLVIVGIWLLGVSVCAFRLICAHWRLRRLLARLPEAQDQDLLILLTNCARQLGLRRPPRILAAPFLNSPAVTGLRQPVLLWPLQLAQALNPDQQRLVLLHELAHIKHQD